MIPTSPFTRRKFLELSAVGLIATGAALLHARPAHSAGPRETEYRFAWSRYTGWEFWGYMASSGIIKKWADKYGVKIKLQYVNKYTESVNQYTAGTYNGVAVTNMDVLTGPSAGGIDSTVITIGDYSNGNDGVAMINGISPADLVGRRVRLAEFSVSHYLLARCLEKNGLKENQITLVNSDDDDIENAYRNDTDPKKSVVTWNPMLMGVRMVDGTTMVFNSSEIPEEILDMMVVRTDTPDNVKKALVGAWFETVNIVAKGDNKAKAAIKLMAKQAGATQQEFETQLKTTFMFYNPADAAAFTRSKQLKQTMDYVRKFSYDHGLFTGARSVDAIGILLPDGTVLGSSTNIQLRFDDRYMQMAADGKL